MPATWSPTDHSQYVGITGTAATRASQTGSAYQSARSDLPLPGGFTYVEFVVTQVGSAEGSGPGMRLGVMNGAASLSDYGGASNNGCTYQSTNGNVIKNAAVTGNAGTFTTGDVIGMAVDMAARTVKFRKNSGTWSATTDITSLGDEVYICASLGNGNTAPNVTVRESSAFPLPPVNVVTHGDSISLTGNVLSGYLPRLITLLRAGSVPVGGFTRCGVNGASWDYAWPSAGYEHDLIADAPLRVDTALVSGLTNWLIVFAGTNGIALGGNSAATEYTNFKTYIAARVLAGWSASRIIVCTMLPRTGMSEATRTTYNNSLVGDDAGTGYKIAALHSNSSIGAAGQNLNTTYFLDGTHPTDAGHQIIAQTIYDRMVA